MRTLALNGCMWCIVSMTDFRVDRPLLGALVTYSSVKVKTVVMYIQVLITEN